MILPWLLNNLDETAWIYNVRLGVSDGIFHNAAEGSYQTSSGSQHQDRILIPSVPYTAMRGIAHLRPLTQTYSPIFAFKEAYQQLLHR